MCSTEVLQSRAACLVLCLHCVIPHGFQLFKSGFQKSSTPSQGGGVSHALGSPQENIELGTFSPFHLPTSLRGGSGSSRPNYLFILKALFCCLFLFPICKMDSPSTYFIHREEKPFGLENASQSIMSNISATDTCSPPPKITHREDRDLDQGPRDYGGSSGVRPQFDPPVPLEIPK